MKNVFFNDDVLEAEKKIISKIGIPSLLLMENAGRNAADYITGYLSSSNENQIVIITGKGNNAGDGFVIARHLLMRKFSVKVILLYKESDLKGDALVNFKILKKSAGSNLNLVYCKTPTEVDKEIRNTGRVLTDSIFGVGFSGVPDKRISGIISVINNLENKFVFSVDIPSCLVNYLQDFPAVKADITLAMGVKKFHSLFYKGREFTGKVVNINIGIPETEFTDFNFNNIFETELSDVKKFFPSRKFDSNKYTNGKVFLLTGSPGLTGASILAGVSALRTGSGAVTAGVPASLNEIMEIKMTEVITLPLKETSNHSLSLQAYPKIREKMKWADVTLIGPGLSRNEETMELVRKIVKENNNKFVIDADAINAFQNNLNLLKRNNIIITPHYGEFSGLINKSAEDVKNNFFRLTKEFSKKHKAILLLKNAPSVITDGDRFIVNSTGRENLATIGSGDVLSGIIAGLYSMTGKAFESAVSGAYLHGLCGDRLYRKYGSSGIIAGDLIAEIQKVKSAINEHKD